MGALSAEELIRYQRQLIIPQIGDGGQKKLKGAKVFLSGLGGLGSISAYYLAAAGIGHLKIVDRDDVETQNLNRQIIHWTNDVGRPKVESAMEKLRHLIPGVHIESVQEELREQNALDLVGDCSLIIDATDNFETRKILNRASVDKNIPFICGGVDCFNGMVTIFIPGKSPCLETKTVFGQEWSIMKDKEIEITINGLKEKVPEKSTISQLIAYFKEEDVHLIVEHNGQFVYPQKYTTTIVSDGDRIEFINPNFGG